MRTKFYVGQKLYAFSIGDIGCIFRGEVISRTEKMMELNMENFGFVKVKIRPLFDTDNGCDMGEWCMPLGRYALCPIFKSDKEISKKTFSFKPTRR
jgi:hypothetical protein